MEPIKPKYVTFKQAIWLKEIGFNEKCKRCADTSGEEMGFSEYSIAKNYNKNSEVHLIDTHTEEETYPNILCTIPEQWQVVEWILLNHGIWISIQMSFKEFNWSYCYENVIYYIDENNKFNSPQEAYSAAFDYIQDNGLIK